MPTTGPFPAHGVDGAMNPDPMLMLMRCMWQTPHGPRSYQGNLGSSEEKIVFSEEEAKDYMRDHFANGERGTLIRIHIQGIWDKELPGLVDHFDQGENDLLYRLLHWFENEVSAGDASLDSWVHEIRNALGLPLNCCGTAACCGCER